MLSKYITNFVANSKISFIIQNSIKKVLKICFSNKKVMKKRQCLVENAIRIISFYKKLTRWMDLY